LLIDLAIFVDVYFMKYNWTLSNSL